MVIKAIDAAMLQKMFLAGAKNIEAKKEYINELNVFPVPDGDTGTNMTLTILSAAKEVAAIENPTMDSLSKAISSGSLRGARGNSGVILSQLFRGFTRGLKGIEEITVPVMAEAFGKAVETAYKAVMKPKEGTILTVAKGGADKAAELSGKVEDIKEFCKEVLSYMEYVLSQTPEMLPVLKEAGVVDSGGQGLLTVLQGGYDVLLGKEIDFEAIKAEPVKAVASTMNSSEVSTADIKFGYCTEFIIMLEKTFTMDDELHFKDFLENLGDSIVVVADEEVVKVHVHTNDPGLAIQKALTYGALTSMKIDNMRQEHNEKVIREEERRIAKEKETKKEEIKKEEIATDQQKKPFGFISVSVGEGLSEIFGGLGVDYLIEGGQTMNPSTADMLDAIAKVHAETIFILPNNKNIILAAEQAAELTEDKEIIVIPTKTIPQGITALVNFMEEKSAKENADNMSNEIGNVKSGQVTYAVRDTSIDGKEIHVDDIMGIGEKGIETVGQDIEQTTLELLDTMVDEDSELVSIFYGEGVTEKDADAIAEKLSEKYPDTEVEVQFGGQPIYYYILSVE
ncbi:MAG: DAK2 domain-containing protein [Lachnospiraceae bacterium]|nr:DAK2 domain-containing protein [Lachnospiraceae bacterium]